MKRLFLLLLCIICNQILIFADENYEDNIYMIGSYSCETENGIVTIDDIYIYDSNIIISATFTPDETDYDVFPDLDFYTYIDADDNYYPLIDYILYTEDQKIIEPSLYGLSFWDKVEKGKVYHFFLIFEGPLERGIETISIIPTKINDGVIDIENITINNPIDPSENSWYIGRVNTNVKLRDNPKAETSYKEVLKAGDAIIYDKKNITGDYYSVISVGSGNEGYIKTKYVTDLEPTNRPDKGFLKETNTSDINANPVVNIYNNTQLTLNLQIGNKKYTFKPQETKTIHLTRGKHYFVASAKRCRSYSGSHTLEKGRSYDWEFYVKK